MVFIFSATLCGYNCYWLLSKFRFNSNRSLSRFLKNELAALPTETRILALGTIAHNAVLTALGYKVSAAKFAHAGVHRLPNGRTLFDSYHCSRYNTNTRRLTEVAFHAVFASVRKDIDG